MTKALEEATAGRDVDGHPLTTRSVDIEGPVQACHVVYVEDADDRRTLQLLERVKDKPILTVSDLTTSPRWAVWPTCSSKAAECDSP